MKILETTNYWKKKFTHQSSFTNVELAQRVVAQRWGSIPHVSRNIPVASIPQCDPMYLRHRAGDSSVLICAVVFIALPRFHFDVGAAHDPTVGGELESKQSSSPCLI